MNEQCIQVNNLTKSFSGRKVINDLSFEVNKGEVAYSAKPAQPFQWNGALFRFNLNVVQID